MTIQSPVRGRCRHRHRYFPSLRERTTGDVTAASFIAFLSSLSFFSLFLLFLLFSSPSPLSPLVSPFSPHKDRRLTSKKAACRTSVTCLRFATAFGHAWWGSWRFWTTPSEEKKRRSLSRPSFLKYPTQDPVCYIAEVFFFTIS